MGRDYRRMGNLNHCALFTCTLEQPGAGMSGGSPPGTKPQQTGGLNGLGSGHQVLGCAVQLARVLARTECCKLSGHQAADSVKMPPNIQTANNQCKASWLPRQSLVFLVFGLPSSERVTVRCCWVHVVAPANAMRTRVRAELLPAA